MKICVFSHCTIDEISKDGKTLETAGGPACYSSLTARKMGHDVELKTKFGSDFPHYEFLKQNKIKIQNALSDTNTTRFLISSEGTERTLYLKTKCVPIEFSKIDADGVIVSPVFDEISYDTLEKIKTDSNFTLLDPQGFVRRINSDNKIFNEKTDLNLAKITAIHVDQDEIFHLTGQSNNDGMKILQKKGVEFVLLTNNEEVSMLVKDRLYKITIPKIDVYDTTGLGDILCAAFVCTQIKEKDPIWSISFAAGAAHAALETIQMGLQKIPEKGAIETNASYFYNTLDFSQI